MPRCFSWPMKITLRKAGNVSLTRLPRARVRNSLVDLLETLGHASVAVASGGEAAARFAADPDFDLLLTDLALQNGMDGAELARTLRDIRPDLPVLVATGYVGDAAFDLPVLPKPFHREDLAAAIAAVVGRA